MHEEKDGNCDEGSTDGRRFDETADIRVRRGAWGERRTHSSGAFRKSVQTGTKGGAPVLLRRKTHSTVEKIHYNAELTTLFHAG